MCDTGYRVTYGVGSLGSVRSEVTFDLHVWSGFGHILSTHNTTKICV
jgi:hypothetical protein